MWQEQKTGSKREVRRKNISPVDILLGHKVKNFMTVIEGVPAVAFTLRWGAIRFWNCLAVSPLALDFEFGRSAHRLVFSFI